MGTLDIIILVCFLPAIYIGIKNGLIVQLLAIVSIVFGAWLSFHFSRQLSAWAAGWIQIPDAVRDVFAFIILFAATSAVLSILAKIIQKTIRIAMMGWLDRLLGLVFALVNCLLIVGLIVIAFNNVNVRLNLVSEDILDQSVLYNPIKDIAYSVFPYFKELLFSNS